MRSKVLICFVILFCILPFNVACANRTVEDSGFKVQVLDLPNYHGGSVAALYNEQVIYESNEPNIYYIAPLPDLNAGKITFNAQNILLYGYDKEYNSFVIDQSGSWPILKHIDSDQSLYYYFKNGNWQSEMWNSGIEVGDFEAYTQRPYHAPGYGVCIRQKDDEIYVCLNNLNFEPTYSNHLERVGDKLYLIGWYSTEDHNDSRLYAYDLYKSTFQMLTEKAGCQSFVVNNGEIYVAYESDVWHIENGQPKEKVIDDLLLENTSDSYFSGAPEYEPMIAWANTIYYVNNDGYLSKQGEIIDEKATVEHFQIMGDYLVIQFLPTEDSLKRLCVIDKNGKIVFQTDDYVDSYSIDGDQLLYVYQEKAWLVQLKG